MLPRDELTQDLWAMLRPEDQVEVAPEHECTCYPSIPGGHQAHCGTWLNDE